METYIYPEEFLGIQVTVDSEMQIDIDWDGQVPEADTGFAGSFDLNHVWLESWHYEENGKQTFMGKVDVLPILSDKQKEFIIDEVLSEEEIEA